MDMIWKDEYEIGLAESDVQHRYFLDLLRRLDEHAENDLHDREARVLLREIDRYAYYHFSSEELLMNIYRYPDLHQRKHKHFNLLQVLDKKICDFRQQGTKVGPLCKFLTRWFFRHINDDDREMARYIRRTREADETLDPRQMTASIARDLRL